MNRGMTGKALRGKTPVTYEDSLIRMREYQRRKRAGLPTNDYNPETMLTRDEIRKKLGVSTHVMRKIVDCDRAKLPDPLDIKYGKATYYDRKQIDNWLPFINELMTYDNLDPLPKPKLDAGTAFFKWLRLYKPKEKDYGDD